VPGDRLQRDAKGSASSDTKKSFPSKRSKVARARDRRGRRNTRSSASASGHAVSVAAEGSINSIVDTQSCRVTIKRSLRAARRLHTIRQLPDLWVSSRGGQTMPSTTRPLALVTGASSGIGADLARELARDGHDLVLAARTVAPMETLAAELKAHGAKSVVITADLGQPEGAAALVREIKSRGLMSIGLISSAGSAAVGRFDQGDLLRVGDLPRANIVAWTELTRLLLPGMVARNRGKVMLVASTAAFQPGPGMAIYFATKAY